jgi:hypothetical protein
MSTESIYEGISHVVHLSTNTGKNCEHCNKGSFSIDDLGELINHYIDEHDYKLLHIGSEFGRDLNGATVHYTAAIVGK